VSEKHSLKKCDVLTSMFRTPHFTRATLSTCSVCPVARHMTGCKQICRYVVKLDPPINRLISVPADHNDCCLAEVCFGQGGEDATCWTLYCLPVSQPRARRFGVGDRVACAVEDPTGDFSLWAAGHAPAIIDPKHENINNERDRRRRRRRRRR